MLDQLRSLLIAVKRLVSQLAGGRMQDEAVPVLKEPLQQV